MKECPDKKKLDKIKLGKHKPVLEKVQKSFSNKTGPDPSKRLEQMMEDFKQDLAAHPLLDETGSSDRFPIKENLFSRLTQPVVIAWSSAMTCLVILIIFVSVDLTPTWADVEKQFGVIDGFSMSIYFRNHIDQRPAFAELWAGDMGRTRIHTGDHVIFMNRNHPTQAFDVDARIPSKPFGAIFSPIKAIQRANRNGMTPLGALIETLAAENMIDTTDLVISDSQVAKDLLVFDACSTDTLWWLRIWALKESKLPVRILKWHRTDGRFMDLQFTYSKAQPEQFFDPDAFAAELENASISRFELMNRFLQDPGRTAFPGPGG